ncbi:hypothetical protein E2C01_091727 [Portunus trituberculatus]|uniref:Uncharacterized protein n=1 Tax=Portunus trituberculatus TaxID=210409 RepID=A0A5B7JTM1_PORTR|nr:hypothetical protein [Portunus trituberculatus]
MYLISLSTFISSLILPLSSLNLQMSLSILSSLNLLSPTGILIKLRFFTTWRLFWPCTLCRST